MYVYLICVCLVCCIYVAGGFAVGMMGSFFAQKNEPQHAGGLPPFEWKWPFVLSAPASPLSRPDSQEWQAGVEVQR